MAKTRTNATQYTALYERLSRDDEQQGESNSITNQKYFLEDYAKKNGFTPTKHFSDDGYSGVTFERPSFKEMIDEVRAGNISTIICKDLSRLGRNYLQVGYFTEILFPQCDVRFIAINNSVDSANGTDNDFTPFINIMNEWYAKDTSKKIRAVFKARMEDGKRCSGAIPYGYIHDPADRQHLLIDEVAAETVRRVFRMTIEGKGVTEIANILTADKVLIPSAYFEKYYPESCRNHNYHDPYHWSPTAVAYILNHEEYLGHTILSKTVGKNFKTKERRKTDKDERIVYKNTHEAIIDQQTWDTAQKCRKRGRRTVAGGTYSHSHRLSGTLYCADCGKRLSYSSPQAVHRENGKTYDSDSAFRCVNYCSRIHPCSIHYIKASAVEKLLQDAIRNICQYIRTDEDGFYREVSKAMDIDREKDAATNRRELVTMKGRFEELDKLIKKLYEDNAAGKISERLYDKLLRDYDEEQGTLERRIRELEQTADEIRDEHRCAEKFVALVHKYTDYSEISDSMMNEFIEKVIVHESTGTRYHKEQQVDIYFSFIGRVDMSRISDIGKEQGDTLAVDVVPNVAAI